MPTSRLRRRSSPRRFDKTLAPRASRNRHEEKLFAGRGTVRRDGLGRNLLCENGAAPGRVRFADEIDGRCLKVIEYQVKRYVCKNGRTNGKRLWRCNRD